MDLRRTNYIPCGERLPDGNKTLGMPDCFHLQAAFGWLELGNRKEAAAEAEKIAEDLRTHPDVLAFLAKFFLEVKDWKTCIEVSTALIEQETKSATAYIYRSYALHCLKRTQEAYSLLLPAVAMFPSWLVPYNLACYCSQLGKLNEAQDWFRKALCTNREAVLKIASDDPDLKPLWKIAE